MKKKQLIFLYFLILFAEIISVEKCSLYGMFALKPLLMPILASIVFRFSAIESKSKMLILVAIFFAWLGVILMFSDPNLFVFGLGAFLVTHFLYIFMFVKNIELPKVHSLLLLLIPIVFFKLILSYVPADFKIPVIIYFSVITTMAALASFRNLNLVGNKEIFAGAILFVISDAILAYNKFVIPLPFSTLFVMSTYGIGQFFIVSGWLKNKKMPTIANGH
jgi:uncharacterized membrane protein YhhN